MIDSRIFLDKTFLLPRVLVIHLIPDKQDNRVISKHVMIILESIEHALIFILLRNNTHKVCFNP